MPHRFDRDERNRGEFSGAPHRGAGELGGYYARDTHWERFGDDYARDGGWSGAGAHDQYARDARDARPSYRGRGPKNWRRSDERICETINELLTDHDGIDATHIEVSVKDAEVTLDGGVGSRWEKRLAEDIALACGGVRDVHNRLRIADRETQIGKTSE